MALGAHARLGMAEIRELGNPSVGSVAQPTPYGMPGTYMPPVLDTDAYVGLMGSSHDNSAVTQTKFDKITLTTP